MPSVDRRFLLLGATLTVLALVSVGVLAIYPFTMDFAMDERDTQFDAPSKGDHAHPRSINGEIRVDGAMYLTYDGALEGDGTAYLRDRSADPDAHGTWARELYEDDGVLYARLEAITVGGGVEEAYVERFKANWDAQVVFRETAGDRRATVLVAVDPDRSVEEEILATEQLTVGNLLGQVAYRSEADVGSNEVYAPRNGWYGPAPNYRVTDATGEVHVDRESSTVTFANVSFGMTPGDSYLAFLQNRDDGVRYTIRYELHPGPVTVEPPEWVEEARSVDAAS